MRPRRLATVAAVLALPLLIAAAASAQPPDQPQSGRTERQATSENQRNAAPPITVAVTAPEPSAAEKEEQRKRAERQDATNQLIAKYTLWLVIVGAIDVVAIFLGLMYTARAARAAKLSAETTTDANPRDWLVWTLVHFVSVSGLARTGGAATVPDRV